MRKKTARENLKDKRNLEKVVAIPIKRQRINITEFKEFLS